MKNAWLRLLVFVLLSGWVSTVVVPSAEDAAASLAIYFGDLGAYVSPDRSLLDPRSEFERARAMEDMDFLGITGREAQPSVLSAAASAVNQHPASRFVALWSRRYEPRTTGQAVNILELAGPPDEAPPPAASDLFYRWWLPRHTAATGGPPIVQFPEPVGLSIDDSAIAISPDTLRDGVPYAATIQIAGNADRYLEYLNEGFRLAPTADSNRRAPSGVTRGKRRTAVLAARLNKVGLVESIRERRVYATDDPDLRLRFSINGQPMGSVIPMTVGTPLQIRIDFSDADEPNAIYWIGLRRDTPGGPIEASQELSGTDYEGDGTVVFTQFAHATHVEYYLVEVRQRSDRGVDVAWTAPIWLTSSRRP